MTERMHNGFSQCALAFLFVFILAPISRSQGTLISYQNQKYGIEAQFPSDFEVQEARDDYWRFDYTAFIPKDKNIGGRITITYNGPQVMHQSKENSLGSLFMGVAFAEPPPPKSLGKVNVGGVQGDWTVMSFGNGEIHNIVVQHGGLKLDIGATWGYVSDFPPEKPLPNYDQERKIILETLSQIIGSLRFIEKTTEDMVKH